MIGSYLRGPFRYQSFDLPSGWSLPAAPWSTWFAGPPGGPRPLLMTPLQVGATGQLIPGLLLFLGISALILAVISILARRHSRRRVAEARLAAMGTATGRILHQIKNPLQTILLHAEMLEADALGDESADRREFYRAIISESARMADLLRRLSTFASGVGQHLGTELVSVEEVIHSVVRRLGPRCSGAGVILSVDRVTELSTHGDPTYLILAVEELVQNAVDALSRLEGSGEGPQIGISLYPRGADLVIEIADNGTGLSARGAAEAFEPFVSSSNAALGLGLPLAREIVEGHGGRLELRSRPGSGTRALVRLPLADRANQIA